MRQMTKIESIFFFLTPGVFVFLAFEYLYPTLLENSWNSGWATFACLWTPVAVMFGFVVLSWLKSRLSFKKYFMASSLSWRDVWLCAGLVFVLQIAESILSPSREMAAQFFGMEFDRPFPEIFLPGFAPDFPLHELLGFKVKGDASVLWFWSVWLIPNILFEELLWRGYALPRMQKAWGRYAWVVNGLLWNIAFHIFMAWSVLALLPISLVLPWLAWRKRSLWVGIILHGLGNALLFLLLVPSVFSK